MKNDSDPSFSEELESLPEWDKSFWLSRAFIEASCCLCTQMLEGEFTSQYSSSRVILHLVRQGIELFLKAAIWAASGAPADLNHNLEKLFAEYQRLYPDLSFYFDVPPCFKVSLNLDLFPETMKSFHSTLDQRHRYPADRKGNSFVTPEIFDPATTLREIEELDKALKILEYSKIRVFVREHSSPKPSHTAS